jgi:uncharacterized protein YjbI with pentapeptide repeats
MANPEHVARLKRGVEGWNKWREKLEEIPDLRGADLSKSNLRGAALNLVDLSGACLEGANLRGARLIEANLSGAMLNGALLEDAWIGLTVFADNDLSGVKGLEMVEHVGPSSIGVDTLYKSGGRIPDQFLREAGVPEGLISYLPSLLNQPIQFYSCFISYNHSDKAFARRIHDTLQGRGIRCWLDEHQMLPGDDIHDQVDHAIRLWDKVLLCCSKASLASWWVEHEIDKAFEKEQKLQKERGAKTLAVIPLNLDGALFEWDNGRASQIRKRVAADFTGWRRSTAKFDAAMEKVVQALRTEREPAPKPLL